MGAAALLWRYKAAILSLVERMRKLLIMKIIIEVNL